MAVCEEAHKRRMLRAGKPYTGKLPVRALQCAFHLYPKRPAGKASRAASLPGRAEAACRALRRLSAKAKATRVSPVAQSPIPADRRPGNKDKAPRIVKWKMDRLF